MSSIRPIPRTEIARSLIEVEKARKGGDDRLSKADVQELEWLKMEFHYELRTLGSNPGDKRERNLYRWEEDNDHLVLDLIYQGRAINRDKGKESIRFLNSMWEPTIRGGLGKSLFYSADFKKGNILSKTTISKEEAGIKGYYRGDGNYDIADASIVLRFPSISLELGKETVAWGPGSKNNLLLSNSPPSFDFFQIRAGKGKVRFTSLIGSLRTGVKREQYVTDDSLFTRSVNASKWIATHRLEITPHPILKLGLNEAMIYGERGIDPAYLNPLMFLWPAQHNWGDQDNEVMSADLEVKPIDGLNIFGSVLIDEVHLGGIFKKNSRNKTATQVGFQLSSPFGLKGFDLDGEYVRVQPGVYTHKYPINTYESWGRSLGFWSGENSDYLSLDASYRPSRKFWLVLGGYNLRRGEATPQPFAHNPDPEKYPFLHGTVETTLTLDGGIYYRPYYNVVLSFRVLHSDFSNYRHEAGASAAKNELSVGLFVKY